MTSKEFKMTESNDGCDQACHSLEWQNLKKLYDRDTELVQLLDAYYQGLSEKELVLITGVSGSGKSALARKIQSTVEKDKGFFVAGKFDPRTAEPYGAFATAISELVLLVEEAGKLDELREKVAASGAEIGLLVKSIKSLYRVLPKGYKKQELQEVAPAARQGRFLVAFRKLIVSVCSIAPLVIVLDDLQWSDQSSLELLDSLISGKDERMPCLIIGTCRGNEVAYQDNLALLLRDMQDRGILITDVRVKNLGSDAVGEMVSDLLCTSRDSSQALAKLVCRQTNGNAFFVMQFLRTLAELNLLYQIDGRWKWNESAILSSLVFGSKQINVVEVLSTRMQNLSFEVQEVMMVAASLGGHVFEYKIVQHLVMIDSSQTKRALRIAQASGLLGFDGVEGRFVHDAVRDAAYSLIPEDDKTILHLDNGRGLLDVLSPEELDKHIFLVVNQLILGGVGKIEQNRNEKEKVSALCLRAARKAALSSAVSPALTYVTNGLNLLDCRSRSTGQYDLNLQLLNLGTELQYCSGNHEAVDRFHSEILCNARTFDDALPSYATHISSLGARGDKDGAIREGLEVLRALGHPLPRKGVVLRTMSGFYRTVRLLRRIKEEKIICLPRATDPNVLATLSIMGTIYPYVFLRRDILTPLFSIRIINLTLKYGLSPWSCVGFGTFAITLSIITGDIQESIRIGRLAQRILDPADADEMAPRVYLGYYGYLLPDQSPLRDSLEPLLRAHRMSLTTGDVEISLRCAALACMMKLYLGTPLSEVVEGMGSVREMCQDYCQPAVWNCHRATMQLALKLMGQSGDGSNPFVLTGSVMQESEALRDAIVAEDTLVVGLILIPKYMAAVYLNDLSVACAADEFVSKLGYKFRNSGIMNWATNSHLFHEGLISTLLAYHARGLRRRNHTRKAKKCLKRLKKCRSTCPANYSNKVYLLEAELASLRGDFEKAIELYDKSIASAAREGFLHEQALACEKAGDAISFMSSGHAESKTLLYLSRSRALYARWGAEVKLAQIDSKIARQKDSSSKVSITTTSMSESDLGISNVTKQLCIGLMSL